LNLSIKEHSTSRSVSETRYRHPSHEETLIILRMSWQNTQLIILIRFVMPNSMMHRYIIVSNCI
jgi:hypothetical protein